MTRKTIRTTRSAKSYCTTRLKLTFSVAADPPAAWKVAVTVSGYVPAAVPGGSLRAPHDGNVARVAIINNKKRNPLRRRDGFPRRLPGSSTRAARPASPVSPTNSAIRFPLERPEEGCRKLVACVVVAVTCAWIVLDPSSVIELGDTVHVAKVGAPLQLSATDWLNPLTGARSTV